MQYTIFRYKHFILITITFVLLIFFLDCVYWPPFAEADDYGNVPEGIRKYLLHRDYIESMAEKARINYPAPHSIDNTKGFVSSLCLNNHPWLIKYWHSLMDLQYVVDQGSLKQSEYEEARKAISDLWELIVAADSSSSPIETSK